MEQTTITAADLKLLGDERRKLDAAIEADKALGSVPLASDITRKQQLDDAYAKGALALRGTPTGATNMLPSGGMEITSMPTAKRTRLSWLKDTEKNRRMCETLGLVARATEIGELKTTPERRQFWQNKLAEVTGFRLDERGAGFINPKYDSDQFVAERRASAAEMSAFGGSNLIPSTVIPDIVELLLEYGTARQISQSIDLPAGNLYVPVMRGFPKAIWNPELNTAPSANELNPVFGNFQLAPKTLIGINEFSNVLVEDAIVNYGEIVAKALIYTLQYNEDAACLTAAGAPQSGIVPLAQAFTNVANTAGWSDFGTYTSTVAASATDFTQIPLTDILQAAAKPRIFNNRPKWRIVCHPNFYIGCLLRLMAQGGGNTIFTLSQSPSEVDVIQNMNPTFLIFPVTLSNIMPSAPAASTTYFYIGATEEAMAFGTRSDISILISNVADQAIYKNTSIIRVMERVDYNAHSVGGTSVDGANTPIAGPVGRYVSHS